MKIVYNYTAALGFERSSVAVNWGSKKPVLAGILCFVRQKSSPKFRLAGQFNRVPPNRAFSIAAAPSAIAANLNGLPERIHRPMLPLIARLANLVEVSRNLSRQSGKMSELWNELTRHAHLVSGNRYGAGRLEFVSLAPLSNLLLNE